MYLSPIFGGKAQLSLLGLARNRYLSPNATYSPTCGRSLEALQRVGVETGSEVGAEPSMESILELAKSLLVMT